MADSTKGYPLQQQKFSVRNIDPMKLLEKLKSKNPGPSDFEICVSRSIVRMSNF